jgi:hypothetical protein
MFGKDSDGPFFKRQSLSSFTYEINALNLRAGIWKEINSLIYRQ